MNINRTISLSAWEEAARALGDYPALRSVLAFGFLLLLGAGSVQAALTIKPMAAYNLVVDSNITSPSTYGPKSATLAAEVCTDADVEDVIVYIGDHTNGTPGIYPRVDSDDTIAGSDTDLDGYSKPSGWQSGFLDGTGEYYFTHEGGSAGLGDATRWIGDIDAGECRTAYWVASYPQCANVDPDNDFTYEPQDPVCDTSVTGGGDLGGSIKPDDDLFISYDIWAHGDSNGDLVPDVFDDDSRTMTMRNEISASANKIWPNTTSKVPTEYLNAIQNAAPVACLKSGVGLDLGWDSLAPDGSYVSDAAGVYPGEWVVTTEGVWYDFGNVGAGFDNDGDLVPDRNAWAQPIGDPAAWDSGCFRLVNSCGVVVVRKNDGTELVIPFEDQLYFENLPDNNRGAVGLVFYQYVGTAQNCSVNMTPYQEVASGFDNEKFSADFGTALGASTSSFDASKDFGFDKTASTAGGIITYTLTGTNDTDVNLGVPDYGVPLMFVDTVSVAGGYRDGSADDGLSVTWADDSTGVDVGETGVAVSSYDGTTEYCYMMTVAPNWKILYSDDDGNSWTLSQPTANTVTDLKWLLFSELVVEEDYGPTTAETRSTCPQSPYPLIGGLFDVDGDGEITSADDAENFTSTYDVIDGYLDIDENDTIDASDDATNAFGSYDGVTFDVINGKVDIDDSGTVTSADSLYDDGIEERSLGNGQAMEITFEVDAAGSSLVCNSASISLGGGSSLVDASNCTIVSGNNEISGVVFEDDGSGTLLANGIQDAGETGIYDNNGGAGDGVTLWLYYDGNGDGDVDDEEDFLLDSFTATTSNGTSDDQDGDSVADPAGFFHFGDTTGDSPADANFCSDAADLCLPDGNYVVIVDEGDNDIPDGYTSSASVSISVDLDSTGANANPVQETAADFGFAPALGLTKTLRSPASVPVGDLVTFEIDVTNLIPGGGTADSNSCTVTAWAGTFNSADNSWNAETAISTDALGAPDGSHVFKQLNQADGKPINVGDFVLNEPVAGYTIDAVEVVLWGYAQPTTGGSDLSDDVLRVRTGNPGTDPAYEAGVSQLSQVLSASQEDEIVIDISGDAAIVNWSSFSTLDINLTTYKGSGAAKADVFLDAVGLRVTYTPDDGSCTPTSATTLNPVPLTDTYDADLLQFVSASVPVTSAVTSGTAPDTVGTLTWDNVGALYPGQTKTIEVTFTSLATVASPGTTNTATSTNAKYADGTNANSPVTDNDQVIIAANTDTGSLSGTIWNDNGVGGGTAGDGIDDATGEPGLEGVRVTLYACKAAAGSLITAGNITSCAGAAGTWAAMRTTTTNGSGVYSFSTLGSGYYIAVVDETTLPPNSTQTGDPNIATGVNNCANDATGYCDGQSNKLSDDPDGTGLTGGQGNLVDNTSVTGVGFGYNATIATGLTIGDSLFYDWDGDGKQDSGTDGGIANISVYLYDAAGSLVDTQVTDSSGRYTFAGLSSGNYTVRVDTGDADFPSAATQTYDPDDGAQGTVCSSCDSAASIALASTSVGTIDFGYQPSGVTPALVSIGDLVYLDVDGNGTRDFGEPGIEDVVMELCTFDDTVAGGGDGDGRYDPGELSDCSTPVATTTTDANGYYAFSSLSAGSYVVRVASTNFDGPDADSNDVLVGATFTADPEADGSNFADFAGCPPGTLPSTSSNAACDAYSGRVLEAGANYFGADFSFQPASTVAMSGTVWNDLDGDTLYWDDGTGGDGVRGYRDIDGNTATPLDYEPMVEEGLAGVTLTLLQDTGSGYTAINTTTTDADGYYSFTTDSGGNALAAGDYRVAVDSDTGELDTDGDNSGDYTAYCDRPDGTTTDSCSIATANSTVTLVAGLSAIGTHVDFGYQLTLGGTNTLSGTVCADDTNDGNTADDGYCGTGLNNNNGPLDTGETGYGGVTVTLFDSAGNRVRTTTTAADGTYSLSGLPSATYTVVLDKPEDYLTLTTVAADTPATTVAGSTDSDGNIVAVRQTVTIGADVGGVDFAFVPPIYDYGDLPISYATRTIDSGPGHLLPGGSAGIWLGANAPDGEGDGGPGSDANTDDTTGSSDEDGVSVDLASAAYWAAGVGSGSVDVTVTTSAASGDGYVVGWLDFDGDGALTGPDELVYSGVLSGTSSGTTHTITFNKTTTDSLREGTYLRFRVFTDTTLLDNLAYKFTYIDGEVEDHKVDLYWDYGDLPTTAYGMTTHAANGARHFVPAGGPKVFIGSTIAGGASQETDGASSDTADNDTEEIAPTVTVYDAGFALADVVVHNIYATKAAQLVGWADFNCDGDFDDTGERSISDLFTSLTTDNDTDDFSTFAGDDDGTFATGNIPAGYDGTVTLRWDNVDISGVAQAACSGTWATTYGDKTSFLRLRITTHGNLASDGESADPENFGFFSDASPQANGAVGDGVVNDSNFDVTPTYVVISRVRAYLLDGLPVIEWQTSGENGTLGFDVERRDGAGGFQKLNPGILPALIGQPQGGTYYFVDFGARAGETLDYRLVEHEVNPSGKVKKSNHGPYTVTVEAQTPADVPVTAAELIAADDFLSLAHVPSVEEQARTEAGKQATKKAKGRKKSKKSSDLAKLFVKEPGVYKVTASEIAGLLHIDAREAEKQIRKYGYALTSQGRDVPYHAADDNSVLYFYNPGYEDAYTDTNVFWLGLDKKTGVAMEVTSAVPETQTSGKAKGKGNGGVNELPQPTGSETFQRTVVAEENVFAMKNLNVFTGDDDFWMWNYLYTAQASARVRTYDLSTPASIGEGEASVRVDMIGAVAARHRVRVEINGTAIGEVVWDGIDKQRLELSFDAALLGETNQLTLHADPPATGYSVVWVDKIALTYPSIYRVNGDRLAFHNAAHPVIGLEGFSDAPIALVEISNPWNPVWVETQANERGDGTFGVTLQPSASYTAYWTASEEAAITVTDVWTDKPSQLRETDFSADYVVIASEETMEAAQALADYRTGTGLSAVVVDVEDIEDEFNHGLTGPWGIRDFLAQAHADWSTPPLYAVLVGGASYDYQDYQGKGGNLIPTVMVVTPFGLAASDGVLGDVVGDDGVPEIVIGRIPALTDAEAAGYLDKVIAYESAGAAPWTRRVILAADNPDKAGTFGADVLELGDLVSSEYAVEPLLLENFPGWNWRDPVNPWRDAINEGASYFAYMGHGSPYGLADEAILASSIDIPQLVNGERLPVALFLTCSAADHAQPGFDSFGELLVVKPDGGAVAVWGPTGLSFNRDARVLGAGFFQETFQEGNRVLGESVYGAHEAYGIGRYRFMHDIYNLLGDPALLMR